MLDLMLPIIETSVNKALSLDTHAKEKLTSLNGKIFKVQLIDWNATIFLEVYKNQIHCMTKQVGEVTATISATLPNFIRIVLSGAKPAALFDSEMSMTGDTHALEQLSHIFKSLDIDWEEQLSQFIGDEVAHKTFFYAKKLVAECKAITDKLCENTSEYLKYESKQLVGQSEISLRAHEVNVLRDDVERLAARIDRLECTLKPEAS